MGAAARAGFVSQDVQFSRLIFRKCWAREGFSAVISYVYMRMFSSSDPDQLFAFVHIEKCGGQTFGRMLRRSYGRQHQDLISLRRSSDHADEADLAHLFRIFPQCVSIMGHNVRPYCDFGRFRPRMVFYTLLRDPVDRYVSDYAMHVRGGFRGTFAQWSSFAIQHNLIVQAFSPRGDLEEAKDVFAETISFHDTLDNFDRFVGRARAHLPGGGPNREYVVVNDAPEGQRPPEFRQPHGMALVREQSAELNRLDLDFYSWVCARPPLNWDAAPSDYGRRVDRERGLGQAINFHANLLMRNLVYKPSCGLCPGEVDSIAKYREPWPVEPPTDTELLGTSPTHLGEEVRC